MSAAVERVLEKLSNVKRTPSGWEAFCPAHGDTRTRHLTISEGSDGRVLLYCHRCNASAEEIAGAIGLNLAGLFEEGNGHKRGKIAATYDYTDSSGKLLFQVVRFESKGFAQRKPDGSGGWIWNLRGVGTVVYRLPDVLEAAESGGMVFITEGEKDADRLREAGLTATTSPMGAGKWRDAYSEAFRGAHVVILPDADKPGCEHAEAVARSLHSKAASVKVLELSGLPFGGELPDKHGPDVSDWLDAGGTFEDLEHMAREAPEWKPEPEPDGARLLENLVAYLRRYVVLSLEQAILIALWIVHTYALDAAETTPYLNIKSAEKRSGKTRLLEVLYQLVARPWLTGRVTAAVLVRKTSAEQPSLLLDESDAAFKGDREYAEALRGILNAGFRRGGVASLCVGQGANLSYKDFEVFCPKAIAGIGKLPDTVADRSIPIELKRRSPSEKVERFRLLRAKQEAHPLREAATAWAEAHLEDLRAREPDLPDELDDRAQDIIEPLLAIANAVGGEWPDRGRQAAVTLLTGANREETESLGVRLLRDLQMILHEEKGDKLPTAKLLEKLQAAEDAPWGSLRGEPLNAIALARLLQPYGISPDKLREGEDTFRGYRRADFEDAWSRYTPDTPGKGGTGGTLGTEDRKSHRYGESGVPGRDCDPEQESPAKRHDVPAVPSVPLNPGTGEEDRHIHYGRCGHGYPGGKGCYLCDPEHPYRKQEESRA